MPRKNTFARVGRPPGTGTKKAPRSAALKATPMAGLDTAVPHKAFNRGGSVGYKKTASHYDCPAMGKGHSEMGYASADAHAKRLCRGGRS
jgi:hypothetical protein